MNRQFDAQVELPSGAVAPDAWDETYGLSLPLDHVISRDKEGNPASCAGDFVWWWTAYHPRGKRAPLYFYYWATRLDRPESIGAMDITPEREARIRELQFLMTRVIYFNEGKVLGYGSLANDKLPALHLIARFAESRACAVRDVLEQQESLDALIGTLPDYLCAKFMSLLTFLGNRDPITELGFRLATPKRWQDLYDRAKDHRDNSRQHAPLPTRIYSALINNLSQELDDIEAHKDQLIGALKEAIEKYVAGMTFGRELVERFGLCDYLTRRGLEISLFGLSAAITETFRICKLQIHVFGGMRDEEAAYLPYHCMEPIAGAHGRKHCLITGITTKLTGSRRHRAKWVTTEHDGFRAIRLAQQCASLIYESIGVTPSADEKAKDNHPLFPSVEYLPWGRKDLATLQVAPFVSAFSGASAALKSRLCPVIEDADIEELEEVDPFRAWREELEFAVGNRWPLGTHQLRRSLALYANASGMVRLSSLRRQLQHLTREMSLYYGRGSTFCKNFIAEDPKGYKKHIAPEWQEAEHEAQCLAFVREVLNSEEPMFGGAGNFYQRKKERGEVMSREEIHKQIKAGRLAYKDGPLGGCLNPEPCNSIKGLNLIDTVCATDTCKHLVGKHSKIIQVIRYKSAAMEHIDPASITYIIEKEDLDQLERLEVAWRSQGVHAAPPVGDKHA